MTSKKSGSDTRGKGSGKDKTAPRAPVKRTWLRVAGILFLAVWMFVLGVLVGRGTAPVRFDIQKLQKELAALKAAALKRSEPAKALTSSSGDIDPADLGFYEDLRASRSKLNFKPAVREKVHKKSPVTAAQPVKRPQPTTTAARTKVSVKTIPAKKAVKTRSEKQPATARKTAKTGASSTPSKTPTAGQRVTIQVASVKSQQVADRMVRDLKRKGYPAYTRIGKVPGKGIRYRIRVGRFASRRDAAGMQARLRRDKWKAVIVSR